MDGIVGVDRMGLGACDVEHTARMELANVIMVVHLSQTMFVSSLVRIGNREGTHHRFTCHFTLESADTPSLTPDLMRMLWQGALCARAYAYACVSPVVHARSKEPRQMHWHWFSIPCCMRGTRMPTQHCTLYV